MTKTNKTPDKKKHTQLNNGELSSRTLDDPLRDLELDFEFVVSQLHQTQEEFEKASWELVKTQQNAKETHRRLSKILADNPDYWEYESIFVEQCSYLEQPAIQWTVNSTYLGNKLHNKIRFRTFCEGDYAGISFQRDGSTDLIHFKNIENLELKCIPVAGSYSHPNNAAISSIGTSDWNTITTLLLKLIKILREGLISDIPDDKAAETAEQLKSLLSTLLDWPKLLRYDSVSITDSTISNEYQAIGIKLENMLLEANNIESFSFRLASVNLNDGNVGQYPRLEFPEQSKSSFDNWYAESNDDRGKRLELRFAIPDEMDIQVWQNLSDSDRLLIGALVSKLPEKIKYFKKTYPTHTSWDDWTKICVTLKSSLIKALSL